MQNGTFWVIALNVKEENNPGYKLPLYATRSVSESSERQKLIT